MRNTKEGGDGWPRNVIGVVNNTESIYYEDDGKKKQTDLQMVIKNSTPSWVVRKMITLP